jgi:hypothetical protein
VLEWTALVMGCEPNCKQEILSQSDRTLLIEPSPTQPQTLFPISHSDISVPVFMIDPSATTFMSAVMTYCSAVLLYCSMVKGPHQDHFLMFGALLGVVSGTLASWPESDLESLKDYIPLSITAALTLSLVWHTVFFGVLGRYKRYT